MFFETHEEAAELYEVYFRKNYYERIPPKKTMSNLESVIKRFI
jgi:hypothetical protein